MTPIESWDSPSVRRDTFPVGGGRSLHELPRPLYLILSGDATLVPTIVAAGFEAIEGGPYRIFTSHERLAVIGFEDTLDERQLAETPR